MPWLSITLWVLACSLVITVASLITRRALRSPFHYPYFVQEFNIADMEHPKFDDMIDNMLMRYGVGEITAHRNRISDWKEESTKRIDKSKMKARRLKQYVDAIDDEHAYVFYFVIPQTMECVVDKKKMYCTENVRVDSYSCSCISLVARYKKLQEAQFRCTLSELEAQKSAE